MKLFKLTTLSPLLAGLLVFASAEDALDTALGDEGQITEPTAESSLTAPIPVELKHLLIEKPHVDFTVLIDENGHVKDSIAIASNHYGLLSDAQKVVEKSKFTPAQLDGVSTAIRYQIRVNFRDYEQEIWRDSGRIPMGSNVMDGSERRLYQRSAEQFQYKESQASELDTPLKVIEGSLVVIEDAEGQSPNGSCRIEYFIDSYGQVKLPRVLHSDNEPVSLSALGSLKKLRFAPPTQNQRPTFVKVRQRFNYGEKE